VSVFAINAIEPGQLLSTGLVPARPLVWAYTSRIYGSHMCRS